MGKKVFSTHPLLPAKKMLFTPTPNRFGRCCRERLGNHKDVHGSDDEDGQEEQQQLDSS